MPRTHFPFVKCSRENPSTLGCGETTYILQIKVETLNYPLEAKDLHRTLVLRVWCVALFYLNL